jgi:predicted RecA/RadA family phage recombinase
MGRLDKLKAVIVKAQGAAKTMQKVGDRARKMEEGMFEVPKLDLDDVFGEKKKQKR